MSLVNKTIKGTRNILLYLLLIVSAISYHPAIVRLSHLAGYESGTILSRYIVYLFMAVFALSFNWYPFKKSKVIYRYVLWLITILVFALLVWALFNCKVMIHDIRTFVIVFGAIMIGYDIGIEDRRLEYIILAFSIPVLFSGIMQVMVNIGGFYIASQYLTDSKNALGAMLATAAFSFFYLARISTKRAYRLIYYVLVGITVLVVLTIRARAAMVALAVVGVYYYYMIKRSSSIIIAVFSMCLIAIVIYILMPSSVFRYLESSFTAGSQGEDFSSGRIGTYLDALAYLAQHPFEGNARGYNHIGWVHNYPLLQVYQYGILFSWPIIGLYLYLLLHTIRKSLHTFALSKESFGYFCLLIPYVISLVEPTFPFGPGTVTVYNFILFGLSERLIDSTSASNKIRPLNLFYLPGYRHPRM